MQWMKAAAAAGYAGVSAKTLYTAVERGDLRAARIGAGRNLLFAAEWIDLWLTETSERNDRAATVLPMSKGA